MTSTYDLDLHFNSAVNLKTGFVFKMGDKGMTFNLHIKDLDPLGMTGKIVFHRSNNTSVESALVGSGSEYTYTILGNEFAVPGVVICDVKFYDEPSQRISTTSFVIGVISDTLDGLGSGTAGYSDELEVLRLAMEQAEQDLQDMSDEFADTLQDYKDAFGNTAPLNPRGTYDPTEEYNPRDLVNYTSGGQTLSYVCKETCTGEAPTNTYYWQVLIDMPIPSVVDNLTSTSTTDALSANQGKVLKDLVDDNFGGQSNENLFDNPWFTVNQRGASGIIAGANVYGYDRWCQAGAGGGYSVTSDGPIILITMWQRVEDNSLLQGEKATFTMLYADGEITSGTGTIGSTITTSDGSTLAFPTNQYNISAGNTNKAVRAVKLELGGKSTLAHDVAPDYAIELAKCRASTADTSDTYANKGNLVNYADVTSVYVEGTTNTSGAQIDAGTLFYLNGTLCKALANIAVNAAFTLNTNYKVDTVNDEIALNRNHKGYGTRQTLTTGVTHTMPSDGMIVGTADANSVITLYCNTYDWGFIASGTAGGANTVAFPCHAGEIWSASVSGTGSLIFYPFTY